MTPKLPSQKLRDLLSGATEWEDADASIQSWARFYIYEAAFDIARLPKKEARKASLENLPGFVRPRVEAELLRIWPLVRHRL